MVGRMSLLFLGTLLSIGNTDTPGEKCLATVEGFGVLALGDLAGHWTVTCLTGSTDRPAYERERVAFLLWPDGSQNDHISPNYLPVAQGDIINSPFEFASSDSDKFRPSFLVSNQTSADLRSFLATQDATNH